MSFSAFSKPLLHQNFFSPHDDSHNALLYHRPFLSVKKDRMSFLPLLSLFCLYLVFSQKIQCSAAHFSTAAHTSWFLFQTSVNSVSGIGQDTLPTSIVRLGIGFSLICSQSLNPPCPLLPASLYPVFADTALARSWDCDDTVFPG